MRFDETFQKELVKWSYITLREFLRVFNESRPNDWLNKLPVTHTYSNYPLIANCFCIP